MACCLHYADKLFCSQTESNDFFVVFMVNESYLSVPVLCFTMTITAVDVLTKYWPFGSNTLFLCRAVKAFPCSAVYLSSITIVIIALDRYRFIVHSSAAQLSLNQVRGEKSYKTWHFFNLLLRKNESSVKYLLLPWLFFPTWRVCKS